MDDWDKPSIKEIRARAKNGSQFLPFKTKLLLPTVDLPLFALGQHIIFVNVWGQSIAYLYTHIVA